MKKIVIIVDAGLGKGLAANAAAAMAFSAAPLFPEGVGPEVRDADGGLHAGITAVPLPILALPQAELPVLRARARLETELVCIDFTETARRSRDYADYAQTLSGQTGEELRYRALCLVGERKAVDRLTGSLPLLA